VLMASLKRELRRGVEEELVSSAENVAHRRRHLSLGAADTLATRSAIRRRPAGEICHTPSFVVRFPGDQRRRAASRQNGGAS